MRRLSVAKTLFGGVLALLGLLAPARAESPITLPGFTGVGLIAFGAGPQYIGADERIALPVPMGTFNLGDNRRATLTGNYLNIDLIRDPNWSAGPAGMLRFGRGDVDDRQVAALPDIDMSLDLGGFVSYEVVGDDIRKRWSLGVSALQDVTGGHGGFVASAYARASVPVGRFGALAMGAAISYGSDDYMDSYFSVDARGAAASGLEVFSAGGGARDARAFAVFIQPVSPQWAIGGGLIYGYLLDDAAGSPVTDSRGQLYAGVGVARLW
jgi:outer membrane scaffolding protein for murein synthesis (MipA/OmpV family)